MKKSLIFKILYLFLVLVVVAGASVFATNTYLASQVTYGSTNVEDALNDLYTLKGNDENYSTDEKIIGKWIDDKPLYRKVYSGTATSQSVIIDSLPANFEVYNIYGTIHSTDGNKGAMLPINFTINSMTVSSWIDPDGKLNLSYNQSVWLNCNYRIIIEYTKNTN